MYPQVHRSSSLRETLCYVHSPLYMLHRTRGPISESRYFYYRTDICCDWLLLIARGYQFKRVYMNLENIRLSWLRLMTLSNNIEDSLDFIIVTFVDSTLANTTIDFIVSKTDSEREYAIDGFL